MAADNIPAGGGAAREWGPGNREWWYPRLLAIAVMALGVAGLWMYQHRNDTLRTQRLEIVDGQGKVCAVLGAMSGRQSGIALQDAHGQTRATLTVGADGNPALALCSPDGMERAGLAISPKGNSTLRLFNDYGQVRLGLQVERDGKTVLKLDEASAVRKKTPSTDGSDNPAAVASGGIGQLRIPASPWHATGAKSKARTRVSLSADVLGSTNAAWSMHSSTAAD